MGVGVRSRLSRALGRRSDLDEVAESLMAMAQMTGLDVPYLPWSGSAMRPSALRQVLNEVLIQEKQFVVEFGPGVSTVYLAALVKQYQLSTRIVSVEHDAGWLNHVDSMLCRANLREVVELIHAPLEPWGSGSRHSPPVSRWYGEKHLETVLRGDPIDLLVVDGPPSFEKARSCDRFPALPWASTAVAWDRLSVMLDDGRRRGERRVFSAWSDEYSDKLHFERERGPGGILRARGEHRWNT